MPQRTSPQAPPATDDHQHATCDHDYVAHDHLARDDLVAHDNYRPNHD
jgi:hypothetical protein